MEDNPLKIYEKFIKKNTKKLNNMSKKDATFLNEPHMTYFTNNYDPMLLVAIILNPIFKNIHLNYHKRENTESILNYFDDILYNDIMTGGMSKTKENEISMYPIHVKNNKIWIYDFEDTNNYPIPRNMYDFKKFMKFVSFFIEKIYTINCEKHSKLMSEDEYNFLKEHKFFVSAHFIWYFNKPNYFLHNKSSSNCKDDNHTWSKAFVNYIEL